MEEYAVPENVWYVKRLAANDTRATRGKQYGPYIPKEFLFRVLPSLAGDQGQNPESFLDAFVDSHPDRRTVRAVWYNNKKTGRRVAGHVGHNSRAADDTSRPTRNEARLTRWGGVTSALIDPDSTGALAAFVFVDAGDGKDASGLHVWVTEGESQAEVIEGVVGPIEPGRGVLWQPGDWTADMEPSPLSSCFLSRENMPEAWLRRFPKPADIVRRAVDLRPLQDLSSDNRLLKRRKCEFEIFRSVEQELELPQVAGPFTSLDDFLERSKSILQRRKSRAGRSLELHTREILIEEGFVENQDFSHGKTSDRRLRPDFLFPSQAAYLNPDFPPEKLRMLAAKTTLKERWAQVTREADRIPRKHILTLQEGVSESDFREITGAGIELVVPGALHSRFPKSVRPHLQTLDSFIADTRLLSLQAGG
jgi:hypothetical protein